MTVSFGYCSVSGNEWKTRFETQTELNGQLERQMCLIHERLEDLRGNPMGECVDRLGIHLLGLNGLCKLKIKQEALIK